MTNWQNCPFANDGAACPHRKTENLVYVLIALMLANYLALGALVLWRTADLPMIKVDCPLAGMVK